uniref:Ribonuclease A-domain domain-containing protein n=1 Tax=Sander lucioperca TaxID=283035 RepID=A0A8C9Y6C9_SANLU
VKPKLTGSNISIFAGFLLLSAAVLSVDGQSWPRFQDKHINAGMTKYQCDDVIKVKEINKINSLCKDRNTFIITTSLQTVKDICGDEGTKYTDPNKPEANNLKKSKKPFEIVDCNLKTLNAKYPDCQYDGTSVEKAYTSLHLIRGGKYNHTVLKYNCKLLYRLLLESSRLLYILLHFLF